MFNFRAPCFETGQNHWDASIGEGDSKTAKLTAKRRPAAKMTSKNFEKPAKMTSKNFENRRIMVVISKGKIASS